MDDTLLEDVKSYTLTELHQLRKMTEDVLQHWKDMLKNDIKEGLHMAIDMSIKQTEDDLKVINNEINVKDKK